MGADILAGVVAMGVFLIAEAVAIGVLHAARHFTERNDQPIPLDKNMINGDQFKKPAEPVKKKANNGKTNKRIKSNRNDDDSSSIIDSIHSHNIARHLVSRLTRWFRFGGILQRIAEDTGIDVSRIVEAGASFYQDRNSGLGNSIHAAHLVRAGRINSSLPWHHFIGLRDFIGHTENVHSYANVGGVGRAIDEFQTDPGNLYNLSKIDFRSVGLTPDERLRITWLVNEYLNMLAMIADRTLNVALLDAIHEAIYIITQLPQEYFQEKGAKGYGADYSDWKRHDTDD